MMAHKTKSGDILNFNVDSTDFYLWDDLVEPNYHADNILTSDNCSGHSYRNFPSGMGTSSGNVKLLASIMIFYV